MIGERILNYRIESKIGEGGVGTVYLATHNQLGRKVAIKVLNPNLVNDPEVRARFRNEAATLSTLQHLNIITLYDYLEEEKGLFLVMEYAPGQALDDYIRFTSGPIPEQKAQFFFLQMLDAFAYAHQKNVIHRDVKPSNIIITADSEVKVLDFGIAKILKEGKRSMTKTGTQLGTVLYMSPEQVQGRMVDHRTDIYSLGITFFEMLTGRCPYNQEELTEYQVYEKILKEPLPSLRSFYPGISERFQSIIQKACAKDPANRYANCEEFKAAILELEAPHSKVLANTQVEEKMPPPPKEKPNPKKEASEHIEKKKNRNNQILIGVLSIMLIFSIWMVWKEYHRGASDSEELTENNELGEENENNSEEDFEEYEEDENYEEEEVEPEQSREEILLDSLNTVQESLEDDIKLLEKERNSQLKKGLLVDAQLENDNSTQFLGELVLRITVANQREDARFEDIVIEITYLDEDNKALKIREQSLEPLNPEKSIEFRIREEIEASKFNAKLKEAKVVDLDKSPLLDSLNRELEIIMERRKVLDGEDL